MRQLNQREHKALRAYLSLCCARLPKDISSTLEQDDESEPELELKLKEAT